MQTCIWRDLRIELPEDWEMLQFSLQRQAGRCAFADRYQFRLELGWRTAEAKPEIERMMSDYLAQMKADPDTADPTRIRVGSWQGIESRHRSVLTSRFSRHLAEAKCLVELVLLWPDARDGELEEQILASVAEEPARGGGLRRWKAFGMDLLVSAGLDLCDCRIEPARAAMVFSDVREQRTETCQRLGMVSEWLAGTPGEWLGGQLPKRSKVLSQDSVVVNGHVVEAIAGRAAVKHWGGLISRPSAYEAAAWLCPADGRLYHATRTGHGTSLGTRLAGQRLSCCDQLELPP